MAGDILWRSVPGTGFDLALTDRADSAVFARFFAGYDRAFVLPNEKEDAAGFAHCLALNHDRTGDRLRASFGRFAEICLIARDSASGAPVGGANFIAMEVRGEAGTQISANLNYVYVDSAARGQGYFGRLLVLVRHAIGLAMAGAAGDPLIFIELNDPVRMSPADYARDSRYTGLDQFDRLRIWSRRGARLVDHAYIQPPLSAGQAPDETLVYGVLSDRPSLSACTLGDHLRKFFAISVLKGASIDDCPAARDQVDDLAARCRAGARIALLDPVPLLAKVGSKAALDDLPGGRPASILEAVRAIG